MGFFRRISCPVQRSSSRRKDRSRVHKLSFSWLLLRLWSSQGTTCLTFLRSGVDNIFLESSPSFSHNDFNVPFSAFEIDSHIVLMTLHRQIH